LVEGKKSRSFLIRDEFDNTINSPASANVLCKRARPRSGLPRRFPPEAYGQQRSQAAYAILIEEDGSCPSGPGAAQRDANPPIAVHLLDRALDAFYAAYIPVCVHPEIASFPSF
jgi:hypothetical protein